MPRDAISTTNATSTAGSTDSETMKGADTTKAMTMIMRVRRLGEILITIDGRGGRAPPPPPPPKKKNPPTDPRPPPPNTN